MVVVDFVAGHTGDECFVGWSEVFFQVLKRNKKSSTRFDCRAKDCRRFRQQSRRSCCNCSCCCCCCCWGAPFFSSSVVSFCSTCFDCCCRHLFSSPVVLRFRLKFRRSSPDDVAAVVIGKSLDFKSLWNFFEAFPMTKRKRIPPTETNPDRWSFALENSERRRRRWRRRKKSRARFLC